MHALLAADINAWLGEETKPVCQARIDAVGPARMHGGQHKALQAVALTDWRIIIHRLLAIARQMLIFGLCLTKTMTIPYPTV